MRYILAIATIGVIWSIISWWKKKNEADRIESAQISQERNYPVKLAFNNNIIQLLHEQENYSVAILSIPGPKNWSEDDRYQRIEDFKFEQIEKIDRLIRSIPDPFEFDEPLTQHHYSHKHSVENQVKSIFESTMRKIYDLNNEFIEENVRIHTDLLLRRMNQMIISNDFGVEDKGKWHRYLADEFLTRLLGYELGKNHNATEIFCLYVDSLLHMEAAEIATKKLTRLADGSDVDDEDPVDINDLSPQEYERHCASLLEGAGWTCALTAASGDQGVDVIAEKNGIRIVFQCKLYSQPVGNSAVQEAIAGKIFEKADIAAVVSNATYTKSAKALASNADVLLLHHDELDNIDELIERMSMDKSG